MPTDREIEAAAQASYEHVNGEGAWLKIIKETGLVSYGDECIQLLLAKAKAALEAAEKVREEALLSGAVIGYRTSYVDGKVVQKQITKGEFLFPIQANITPKED